VNNHVASLNTRNPESFAEAKNYFFASRTSGAGEALDKAVLGPDTPGGQKWRAGDRRRVLRGVV
jgi:hypothetical protein